MENLMESNERTLVIFDSVSSGIAECLAMVHADIKQMTAHKEKLAQAMINERRIDDEAQQCLDTTLTSESNNLAQNNSNHAPYTHNSLERSHRNNKAAKANNNNNIAKHNQLEDDPHHLARLKMLDKRLADTFSQALTLCDQQNSSIIAKQRQQQANNAHRTSIFQVLLGKTSLSRAQSGNPKKGSQRVVETELDDEQEDSTSAIIEDISRQIRLAMQYSKQLEAHLFKIEDLRARYEMHLKMGLAVKSVSRAYLSNSSSPSSSPALPSSSSSLRRHSNRSASRLLPQNSNSARQSHHTSSLFVNDSSSSLGTQSSVSSLNLLSTWSLSRRNKQQHHYQQQQQRIHSQHQQMQQQQLLASQRCVSTISLDSQSRRSRQTKTVGLTSKLISPDTHNAYTNNSATVYQCYHDLDDSPQYLADYLPPVDYDTSDVDYRSNGSGKVIYEQDMGDYLENHHIQSQYQPSPVSRYSYGDYVMGAVPTTMGTMAGFKSSTTETDRNMSSTPLVGGQLLHKSASQSSLKRSHKHSSGCQTGKTTIKEFIENINRLETIFESYMGSIMLSIEDIQGFARVCQGDVFEVQIKYGDAHKFKTKISVLKDNRQKCDNRQTVFKAKIADIIAIKAYECKGLGKKVLLGNKLCETRDLFTARSQLMTISLNQTGSIKLNLIITWNPLHMVPDLSTAQVSPGHDVSHISLPRTTDC